LRLKALGELDKTQAGPGRISAFAGTSISQWLALLQTMS
jgi:hypothetical protein